ncbi:MAG: CoA pyrophosphatase [Acidobacteriia bacterium]|nr:CoA pyrophosphatase [Terriglobia bacterium]
MWLDEVERLLAARPVRRRPPDEELIASAVLVPLYVAAGSLWAVLTRRSDSLPNHGGQLAFPGGAVEEGDEDEVATALREAHEELGVDPSVVVVLGQLDDVRTPSGFMISPVVGALPAPLALRPSSEEVAEIVPVALAYLANPEAVETEELLVGRERITSPVFHYRGHRVWGATARIISDLVSRLTGAPVAAAG